MAGLENGFLGISRFCLGSFTHSSLNSGERGKLNIYGSHSAFQHWGVDSLQDQSKRFQFVSEPKAVATSGQVRLVTSWVSSRGECLNMQEEKKRITFHIEATESSGMMRCGLAVLMKNQQSSGSACTCGAGSQACAGHRRSSVCLLSLALCLEACHGVAWLYPLCVCVHMSLYCEGN